MKKRDVDFVGICPIEQVRKGAFISPLRNGKPTSVQYQFNEWCRFNKAYECDDLEDISRVRYIRKGTEVYVHINY